MKSDQVIKSQSNNSLTCGVGRKRLEEYVGADMTWITSCSILPSNTRAQSGVATQT